MPSSNPLLDAAEAERILQADVANIVRRVAQGVPLTPAQRQLMESVRDGQAVTAAPVTVRTKAELARLLGITRQLVDWHGKQPGAPRPLANGRHDVSAWRAYLANHGTSQERTTEPGRQNPRQRLAAAQAARQEFRLAVERGEYTKTSDVERDTGAMIGEAKRVLLDLPHCLAPQVVGETIPQAERILREGICAALAKLSADPLGRNTAPAPTTATTSQE